MPGRAHARHLLRRVATTPRADSGASGGLADLLDRMRRPQRRRGLVAVVSDFLDGPNPAEPAAGSPPDWDRPLRALHARHQLLGIEVLRPRVELPAGGLVTFVDPESG